MPAEYEPHAATWVAWPHNRDNWPEPAEAEHEFATLVAALADSEPVHVLVQTPRASDVENVHFHVVPTDDAWVRDTGPTFVLRGDQLFAIDWTFNAWGGRYEPYDRDAAVAARIAELAGVPVKHADLVVEGGALEVDGLGTLIATRSSILDPKRNPGLTEARAEQRFRELLGVETVLWLDGELPGDDTDGHVDNLARFTSPGHMVCALPGCAERLRGARDARGLRIEVDDLPLVPPLTANARPLPASYANFYVANTVVIVPSFGVPTDGEALDVLTRAFPERQVVGVPCRNLLNGLGGIHCLTQQQPRI